MRSVGKIALRRKFLKKRRELDRPIALAHGAAITRTVCGLDPVSKADRICAYRSYDNEPDISGLLDIFPSRKIYFPKVTGKGSMNFHLFKRSDAFMPGYKGIPEPDGMTPVLSPEDLRSGLTVFLMPGVVFSPDGNRIGSGGGYFDRYLANLRAQNGANTVFIGIAYQEQIFEDGWVAEPNDIRMDYIITEKNIYAPRVKL